MSTFLHWARGALPYRKISTWNADHIIPVRFMTSPRDWEEEGWYQRMATHDAALDLMLRLAEIARGLK